MMTRDSSPIPGTSSDQSNPTQGFAIGGSSPYMIGIGGCGMSALARMLSGAGLCVQGCDSTQSIVTEALNEFGIDVGFDEDADSLPEDIDVVLASAAVKPNHPMVIEATNRGLSVLSYPEALGACMIGRTGIAIAGTHGKSTTTAMLGCALTDANLDPSVIVGATCQQLEDGALAEPGARVGCRVGSSTIPQGDLQGKPGLLVAEACEFNRSFHNLNPTIASISSIEADHLDIYGSLDAVVESFAQFAQLIPSAEHGGKLIIGHDGAFRREVTAGLQCDVETIGFNPGADWVVGYDAKGQTSIQTPDGQSYHWTMSLPGEHNAMNSAVAFALAMSAGADPDLLARSFNAFNGLDRRLQYLGSRDSVRVIDDYGHHPTEIDATLRALRSAQDPAKHGGRLICVFQPHQHSRTRFLLDEFATSFEHADVVIVPHIYFVRDSEAERNKVNSSDLVDRLRARGVKAMHLYPFEAIIEQLENMCRPGDLLVVMGAGPVWQVGQGYLDAGKDRSDLNG
ncbi:MAG: UDP-N-acetylmuramate--L-alanine ligase [Phycisphaerales bacterium]|nr:UDP-N-acetylmuramate--L-alanine ligase [Phycisphaerales bacterium]